MWDRLIIFVHENLIGLLLSVLAMCLVYVTLVRRAEVRPPRRNFGLPPDHPQRKPRR